MEEKDLQKQQEYTFTVPRAEGAAASQADKHCQFWRVRRVP